MATTDELAAQAAAADTPDQLDAIAAQSNEAAVQQAVLTRRDQLAAAQRAARPRAATAVQDAELGPNATTDPAKPKDHYYEIADGEGGFRKINAFGEEKGSPEDKRRW